MISAIAETLPLALGIALNPVAVVTSILIMRDPRSRRIGPAFVAGWVLGLVLLVVVPTLYALDQVRTRAQLPAVLLSGLWVGLGIVLLLFAVHALRNRPAPGEPLEPQRWTRLVSRGGIFRVFGVGLFLSLVSLRNLALVAAAVSILSQTDSTFVEPFLAFAAFLAVSSAGVLVPALVRLLGGDAANATLDAWATWLTAHMRSITAMISALLGLYLLARGLSGLLPMS